MRNHRIYKICFWAGGCLLAVAMLALLLWQWNIHRAKTNMETAVMAINAAMPKPRNTVAEVRRDNTMPILAVDGCDYIGILEIPRYDSELPIQANWGSLTDGPCRYSGNVYEGTLQLGATTQKGQYDFYRELSVGDGVYFTDVTGNRYGYLVTDLHYGDHADGETLRKYQGDLTIFIKNIYSRQYLILTCNTPG